MVVRVKSPLVTTPEVEVLVGNNSALIAFSAPNIVCGTKWGTLTNSDDISFSVGADKPTNFPCDVIGAKIVVELTTVLLSRSVIPLSVEELLVCCTLEFGTTSFASGGFNPTEMAIAINNTVGIAFERVMFFASLIIGKKIKTSPYRCIFIRMVNIFLAVFIL
ncbi:hypothetical protein KUL49_03500 [Alteromonas sp. KUL49]|nr:hypothetical protein KUL49_03500 [Alteromonas sp. KUL49]